ncbi:arf-GAP with coiled-coil [Huso huso]|uniref:Arf-GAP with coiled-coil, ANK repeat and PH domain-containing protein n=1 Tax=Huso huso TaxID=61971 RepID=A0ABR0YJ62_HUSHU
MASIVFVVVLQGSLIACEFLLQNAADVNQRDIRGRGPLHHATYLGHTGQVCLFLKRGANQHGEDADGQDPLSIAVQAANADIVTLLRLARMNEEMRESEGPFGQPGDATYLDIFREFSNMASNNPEKLNRRSVHFSHSCRRGRELASLDLLLLEMSSQPVNENNVN